jgi:uncharacterized protein YpiB (UPF0302 family)
MHVQIKYICIRWFLYKQVKRKIILWIELRKVASFFKYIAIRINDEVENNPTCACNSRCLIHYYRI